MTKKKPVLNETYQVLPKNPEHTENESFILKVIDVDHELYDWVFKINSLALDENEKEEEAKLTINYDVLEPKTLPDNYKSSEDEQIVTYLGDIVVDILEMAIQNNKFTIEENTQDDDNTDT